MKKALAICCLLLITASFVFSGGRQGAGASDAHSATGPFDWRRYSGETIRVAMVTHNTTESMLSRIADFTNLTGIRVETSVTPETNYYDRLTASLASRRGDPDLFMAGPMVLWDYSGAGFVEDLTPYLQNSSLVAPDYDFDDILRSTVDALKWDGIPGSAVGTGPQLALPLGCEVYSLAYNKRAFQQIGRQPPRTLDELLEVAELLQGWNGPGSYGLATRGILDWATIHPAYMSTFAMFGARDFTIENDRLVSQVNSPESIRMNQFYVDLIRRGGPPNWASYSWYDVQVDMGEGMAAMAFDADNNPVMVNMPGSSPEAGNIAFTVMPVPRLGDTPRSNFWTWAIAMNAYSRNKGAAWMFLQYVTSKEFLLYASTTMNNLDPVRRSVWESQAFRDKMAHHEGYIETFLRTIDHTTIIWTPQPMLVQTATEWTGTLQDMVAGRRPVQAALDDLKQRMDIIVRDISARR